MKKEPTFSPQDLIPEEWQDIYCVLTEEDLLFMGSSNLHVLWRWWRNTARALRNESRTLYRKSRFYADVVGITDQTMLDKIVMERKRLSVGYRQIDSITEYLEELMRGTEKKPFFPAHRPADYFSSGGQVRFFTAPGERILPESANHFARGRVILNETTERPTMVTMVAEEPFHNGAFGGGRGAVFGAARPEILLDWEFTYLQNHPDYLETWLHCADVETQRGFDRVQFREALLRDRVVDTAEEC